MNIARPFVLCLSVLLLLLAGVESVAQAQSSSPYVQVSAGSSLFSLALRADGTLWAWGSNSDGALGVGAGASLYTTPQAVALPAGISTPAWWVQCSAGAMHSLGITSDGQLWAWGAGALGTGNGWPQTVYRPVPVSAPAGTQWSSCVAGTGYSVAIRTDGTLWQWGTTPLSSSPYDVPVPVATPATAVPGTAWARASAGYYHVLALRTDGTLWAWGYNNYGMLGDGTNTNRYAPVPVAVPAGAPAGARWVQAVAGRSFSLALLSTGTLYGWGQNERGVLGALAASNSPLPMPLPPGAAPGTQWQLIQAGTAHALGLLSDGSLWTWGENVYGQLAINSQADSSMPQRESTGGTWAGMSGGLVHTLAIGSDGGIYAAGAATKAGYPANQWNDGQLGDGTRNGSLTLRRSLAVTLASQPAVAVTPNVVYPNPAHDWLLVENLPLGATLQLKNCLGQIVKAQSSSVGTTNAMAVSELPAGLYWLTVGAPNGRQQTTRLSIE